MEHLPQGVADEEGCFVYQVCNGPIAVRSKLNVGDEDRTEEAIYDEEMVSIDLVRPSRIKESKNGPFLRLSDCSGWLFEKKKGDVMMRNIPVTVGLWTFIVDNAPAGIGLRRHPIDRSDMCVDDVTYKPMQKIHCDRKVQNPSTGIHFYRVQGTEGWVFDRRPSDEEEGGYEHVLLDENMIERGLFVYECICDPIGIRKTPEAADDNTTDLIVKKGQLICANLIRKSPSDHGDGPFLRLEDGSGWLFVNKGNIQLMKRVPVARGIFQLRARHDIALRRQPIDSQSVREPRVFLNGEIIRCTHMAQASSGVNFCRVEGDDGWVFDEREDYSMLQLLSEQRTIENGSAFAMNEGDTSWSPDFVRGIATAVEGVSEISFNERSRVISFGTTESVNVRINVYYTTRTIGTALSHPSQGATQLFRRNCTTEELVKILENPRAHTGKGYKRRRNNPSSLIDTPHGRGLLVDQESELRNELIELDEEMNSILLKRKRILERIRDTDLERAQESIAFQWKIDERASEYDERKRVIQERILARQRDIQAARELEESRARAAREAEQRRAQELRNRTCSVCSRVFQNWHAKQQHYDAVHVFRCNVCYKEFNNMHSLNQHRDALYH